ncbi:NAD(P)H-dependent glycerol-3-phosphate dehydrogenase [Marivita sp. XM-24bin2]|jgi:glycerol-3-phosphate dehydrogenase (NAD(P)+)|uniref:NAD(P)H-dependent glycerol-3-phosphate dehydrogenase n=1 Tax=unclassified Marivita TaxID=2632480 RepID=UPI000D7B6269|nr:NAD(P)H-dependent glycerol-3-phosphate dehydrogenase [Marivita sp. XM-24bin2]MCR9110150.1 NAD(P)-dependent glycerol-3-phosphate dehydrogenase [Paracoccaceae bacterium]PWL30350.1 MAG: glycerol-3-phosphate dehydrogenase [Marivita sp. XM-24bin2]
MIGVMGAGAFGTALAIALAKTGQSVLLWCRSPDQATRMAKTRCNEAYLPSAAFPDGLQVTQDFPTVCRTQALLVAIPLQNMRSAVSQIGLTKTPLVACSKGIELSSGLGPTGVLRDVLPGSTTAILTGPSFAADIALGRPTALTLACSDGDIGETLQAMLTTPTLRLYRTTDTIGAEMGGALKNVMAIACGAVIGAGLGDSARAATMTRGFAEMQRIGAFFGARTDTLAGLSGLGDLALTCTSDLSRNYQLGLSLGRGAPFDTSITVEGAATAQAMSKIAREKSLDLPITTTVARLVEGSTTVGDAIEDLMTRPLKEE